MAVGYGNAVALLMAPEQLPACFSFEDADEGADRAMPPRRPPLRLRSLTAAVARTLAARAAESRKRSAAAW